MKANGTILKAVDSMWIARTLIFISVFSVVGCKSVQTSNFYELNPNDLSEPLTALVEYAKDRSATSNSYFSGRDTVRIASKTYCNEYFCAFEDFEDMPKEKSKVDPSKGIYGSDGRELIKYFKKVNDLIISEKIGDKKIEVVECTDNYLSCYDSLPEYTLISTPILPTATKDYYFFILKMTNIYTQDLRFEVIFHKKKGEKIKIVNVDWSDYCL